MGQPFGRLVAREYNLPLPDAAPILKSSLPEDVRLCLLSSIPCDEEGLRSLGFEEHVDHPSCPGHKYMEGYFHAIHDSFPNHVESIHPRLGDKLMRRPAPKPLYAFCEAFRRANSKLFADLREDLAQAKQTSLLANLLDRHMHFADLSIQVHWGDAVQSNEVAWHVDAPNSFLHLAVGISGSRALHVRRDVHRGRVSQNCLVGYNDEREVLWQSEGDAYMTAPCCFPHAVQYPACSWENRTIAVQMRLFLTEEELFGGWGVADRVLDIDPQGGTAAIVFKRLAAQGTHAPGLTIPRLDDIQNILAACQK